MKKAIAAAAAAVILVGFGTTAFAGSCPKDMKTIDAALAAGPQLSEEQLAQVTELRAEGEAHHKAGKHAESVEVLHEAMHILGIE